MKFIARRTSKGLGEPCEEAEWDSHLRDWVIEINSLEKLLEFQRKHGNLIIKESLKYSELTIEIYDSWREMQY